MAFRRIPSWTRSWWRTIRGWRKENASSSRTFCPSSALPNENTLWTTPEASASRLGAQHLTSNHECTTVDPQRLPDTHTKGMETHTDPHTLTHWFRTLGWTITYLMQVYFCHSNSPLLWYDNNNHILNYMSLLKYMMTYLKKKKKLASWNFFSAGFFLQYRWVEEA